MKIARSASTVPLTCNFILIFYIYIYIYMWANIEPLMSGLWADSKPLMTHLRVMHLLMKTKVCALFCSCLITCVDSHELVSCLCIEHGWVLLSHERYCTDRDTLYSVYRLVPVQIQTQSHSCFHSQAGACTNTDTVTFLFPLTGRCLYRYRHGHILISYS